MVSSFHKTGICSGEMLGAEGVVYHAKAVLLVVSIGMGTGMVEANELEKIVGGYGIDIEKTPFMLSFMLRGWHACGACILNEDWAVTAGHCVRAAGRKGSEVISVRSGSEFRNAGGVLHRVTSTIVHEKYDELFNDYDIALLRVEPAFSFNRATQPVRLLEDYSEADTSWALVAGWGSLNEEDTRMPKALRYVLLPKVDKDVCRREYKDMFLLTERQVCYGFEEGTRDTCKGDSGGPLVNLDRVLLGITSWGAGCGEPGSPGVYTDVILLRHWIRDKIAV